MPSSSPTPSSHTSSPERFFRREPRRLAASTFDMLVIGGGSIGAAMARDAALRGFSVALVDREDFGAGTVSRSTRLIHGGLRYLELYDFRLVREALREREILLRIAPHLVRPLPFLTPIYRSDRWSPFMVAAGMLLYDLLSFDKSLPTHRMLNVGETLHHEPGLKTDGLLGGALYYDAQVASPERLCLAQAQNAAQAGAVCANHVEIIRYLEEEGRVVGAEARDLLTGETFPIRATVTVNATGPWVSDLSPPPDEKPRLRRTQGAHLVVPRLTDHAVVLLAQRDGRVFFVVPWQGKSLIGTTDTDFSGDPRDAAASPDDARYLIEETRRVFPHADLRRIESGFSGVRPLLPSAAAHESQVSREHRILDHAEEGKPGLLSVLGGKITTARAIAEDAVDMAQRQLGRNVDSSSSERPFWGGDLPASLEDYSHQIEEECRKRGLPPGTGEAWVAAYGSEAEAVLQRLNKQGSPLLPDGISPALAVQLAYGLESEMGVTTADLLLRRTLVGYEAGQGLEIAPTVAEWLGKRLNRSQEDIERDLEDYRKQARLLACPDTDGYSSSSGINASIGTVSSLK